MTYSKLYLYYGVMARGEIKTDGTFHNAPIGFETLIKVRDYPLIYEVKPILKPRSALNDRKNKDSRDALDLAYKIFVSNEPGLGALLTFQAQIINTLRERGYDCDNLIDQGLAICHPDYDVKKLL